MNIIRRIFCCQRYYSSGVYRLKLENDKIYIGKSNDIEKRIWCHVNDNGSVWTKKYPVIERLPLLSSFTHSRFWELEETLENMYAHGIDNVRGSMFSRIKLTNEDKIKAARLYCEMYDLCLNCGSKDHYISKCPNRPGSVEPWVHKFGGKLTDNIRRCDNCSVDINHKPNYHRYCEGCYSLS